jgi:hypothetical protein
MRTQFCPGLGRKKLVRFVVPSSNFGWLVLTCADTSNMRTPALAKDDCSAAGCWPSVLRCAVSSITTCWCGGQDVRAWFARDGSMDMVSSIDLSIGRPESAGTDPAPLHLP